MKTLKNRRSRIIIVCAAVILSGIAAMLIIFLPQKGANREPGTSEVYIHYYPADYDADILQNKVYLSYDRDLFFGTQFDERQYHYETDRSSAAPEAAFFMDYFETLIHGDEEWILEFFVDGYFQEKPHFTMQMIHDMRVLLHDVSKEEIDGKETEIINYTVTYEIFQNNGTWRIGVGSNDARAQIYQLIQDDSGAYKIFRILDVTYE